MDIIKRLLQSQNSIQVGEKSGMKSTQFSNALHNLFQPDIQFQGLHSAN